ncbi:acyltransferase family protein [Algoriphagus resistens]|uniref:acyltransferase family protein n=1 Tax=Algoriphagus resistens TaxID=1750590 RepID=UPI0007169809|nr:acyltransferase [Algoriphagus resistens]
MTNNRRYDIDWIRVIVFDVLILYHIGMFFVPWDWELKNNELVEWLRWPMLFVNRWRLPILFVISGMGTRFALSHRSGKQFAGERFTRLFLPLLAGTLIVVPPQIYLGRIAEGYDYSSYITFYPQFFSGVYPIGNFSWAHLWFLPYLLLMSLAAIPLFLYLRRQDNVFVLALKKWITKSPLALYLFIIPLFLIEVYLEPYFPVTNSLVGDWYALVHFFTCFIAGFILICIGDEFWVAVKKIKNVAILIGVISFPTMLWMWENYMSIFWIPLFASFNRWSWILAIIGYAATFLNKKSKVINYRNRAVYPFYILHQTLIIIIGYYLIENSMHYGWKMLLMLIGTFGGCWFLYELVLKRVKILYPFFGIKDNKGANMGEPVTNS